MLEFNLNLQEDTIMNMPRWIFNKRVNQLLKKIEQLSNGNATPK